MHQWEHPSLFARCWWHTNSAGPDIQRGRNSGGWLSLVRVSSSPWLGFWLDDTEVHEWFCFKIISWTVSTLEGGGSIMLPEGKLYQAKPKRKSRTFGFWFAISRPNRVFQSQKVAQNAPLLPYFLEHEENLGSEKSLFEPFSWPTVQMNHPQHLKNAPHFLAIVRPVTMRPSGPS